MSTNGSGGERLAVVDRFEQGVGWIANPDETMQRCSHAVESDGELWILDPVDADGLDDLLEEYRDPAGVVVLLDRHLRDSDAIATRYDVPVYVPHWMSGVAGAIDAPTRRFGHDLAGFEVDRLIDTVFWQEATLFDGETLVVPEALGTADYYLAPGETVGVHPMLRVRPPTSLREYDPDRLLVGHGQGITDAVGQTIRRAIDGGRRRALSLYWKQGRDLISRR